MAGCAGSSSVRQDPNIQRLFQFLGFHDENKNNVIEKQTWTHWTDEGYIAAADADGDDAITGKEALAYVATLPITKIAEATDLYQKILSSKEYPLEMRKQAAQYYAKGMLSKGYANLSFLDLYKAVPEGSEGLVEVRLKEILNSKVFPSIEKAFEELQKGTAVFVKELRENKAEHPTDKYFLEEFAVFFACLAQKVNNGEFDVVGQYLDKLKTLDLKTAMSVGNLRAVISSYYDNFLDLTIEIGKTKSDHRYVDFALKRLTSPFCRDILVPRSYSVVVSSAIRTLAEIGQQLHNTNLMFEAVSLSTDKKIFEHKDDISQRMLKNELISILVQAGINTNNIKLIEKAEELANTMSSKDLNAGSLSFSLATLAKGYSYFPNNKEKVDDLFDRAFKLAKLYETEVSCLSSFDSSDYPLTYVYSCKAIAEKNFDNEVSMEEAVDKIEKRKLTLCNASQEQYTDMALSFNKIGAYVDIADELLKKNQNDPYALELYGKAIQELKSFSTSQDETSKLRAARLIYRVAHSKLSQSNKSSLYEQIYTILETDRKQFVSDCETGKNTYFCDEDQRAYREMNYKYTIGLLMAARIENQENCDREFAIISPLSLTSILGLWSFAHLGLSQNTRLHWPY